MNFRLLNIVVAPIVHIFACVSTLLFFSKPFNKLNGGDKQITEQHYQYKNSGDVYNSKQKAREVHKAILDLDMAYFRLGNVVAEVDQSRSAVHYHLKELERRGYVLKVGVQYVDAQSLEDWNLWQLKRLWQSLEEEREHAKKVAEIYKEKKELKKEHLQELKEQSSNRWQQRQVKQLHDLQESIDYQEQKAEVMHRNAKALFRLIIDRKNDSQANCEKSESSDMPSMLERLPIAT